MTVDEVIKADMTNEDYRKEGIKALHKTLENAYTSENQEFVKFGVILGMNLGLLGLSNDEIRYELENCIVGENRMRTPGINPTEAAVHQRGGGGWFNKCLKKIFTRGKTNE